MRRAAAIVLAVVLMLTVVAPPAQACVECVALGLASFAVFTQLVSALAAPRVVYTAPAYYAPAYYSGYGYPAVAASYPGAYYPTGYPSTYRAAYAYPAAGTPAAWTGPRVVQYPHGRYELRGDGVGVPYVWVWIPTATPPVASDDGPEGSGARTR